MIIKTKKHIEKLMNFIEKHDPSKVLNTLSQSDNELKEIWKQAQSNKEWRKINSRQEVEYLIKCFENCVLTLPKDIRERNNYINEVRVAQYKVMRGLKKWCKNLNDISVVRKPEFPDLTEADVERLILQIENIIKQI